MGESAYMNHTAPVAAKELGISVSMFRRVMGELHIVPVAWRQRAKRSKFVRIALYSPEQVQRIGKSFVKQVGRYAK